MLSNLTPLCSPPDQPGPALDLPVPVEPGPGVNARTVLVAYTAVGMLSVWAFKTFSNFAAATAFVGELVEHGYQVTVELS